MLDEFTTTKCTTRLSTTPRDVYIFIVKTTTKTFTTLRVVNSIANVENLNSSNIKEFSKQLTKGGFDTNILAPRTLDEIMKIHAKML